jgi:hypothetical protein
MPSVTAVQYPPDPRIPLGVMNHSLSPVHPGIQLQAAPVYSPRDPRLLPQVMPVAQYMVPQYAYGQTSPQQMLYTQANYGQSIPLPPYQLPSNTRPRAVPSKSQPPKSRRHSFSESSDSDDAEAISRQIMGSSDDPRELKKIIKSTRKVGRHRSAASPRVDTRRGHRDFSPETGYYQSRDESAPTFLDVIRGNSSASPPRRSKLVHETKKKIPKRRSQSVTPPAVPQQSYDDEIPAGRDPDWFNENEEQIDSPPRLDRRKQKSRKSSVSSVESSSRRRKEKKEKKKLIVTTSTNALVPVYTEDEVGRSSSRSMPRSRATAVKRPKQRDQIGEKVQTWWNPIVTGKRQRLPVLDWRKGEKYNRAPDGTVIGKEGFENLVFDDTAPSKSAKSKRQRTEPSMNEEGVVVYGRTRKSVDSGDRREKEAPRSKTTSKKSSTASSRRSSTRSSRRSSVVSVEPEALVAIPDSVMPGFEAPDVPKPLMNAFDYLEKDEDGIYCLKNFRLLHRRLDRRWEPRDEVHGFRLCPSIATDDTIMVEVAMDPGKSSGTEPETLKPGQAMYGRVLKAAPGSIRLQVNGNDIKLMGEEDEFYVDQGNTYFITNLSQSKAAVLSLTAFHAI